MFFFSHLSSSHSDDPVPQKLNNAEKFWRAVNLCDETEMGRAMRPVYSRETKAYIYPKYKDDKFWSSNEQWAFFSARANAAQKTEWTRDSFEAFRKSTGYLKDFASANQNGGDTITFAEFEAAMGSDGTGTKKQDFSALFSQDDNKEVHTYNRGYYSYITQTKDPDPKIYNEKLEGFIAEIFKNRPALDVEDFQRAAGSYDVCLGLFDIADGMVCGGGGKPVKSYTQDGVVTEAELRLAIDETRRAIHETHPFIKNYEEFYKKMLFTYPRLGGEDEDAWWDRVLQQEGLSF